MDSGALGGGLMTRITFDWQAKSEKSRATRKAGKGVQSISMRDFFDSEDTTKQLVETLAEYFVRVPKFTQRSMREFWSEQRTKQANELQLNLPPMDLQVRKHVCKRRRDDDTH